VLVVAFELGLDLPFGVVEDQMVAAPGCQMQIVGDRELQFVGQ